MLFTKAHEYFKDKRSNRMPTESEMQQKLLALLESKQWDVSRAAKQMGISNITLWRIIRDRPNLARARLKARLERAIRTGVNPGIR